MAKFMRKENEREGEKENFFTLDIHAKRGKTRIYIGTTTRTDIFVIFSSRHWCLDLHHDHVSTSLLLLARHAYLDGN